MPEEPLERMNPAVWSDSDEDDGWVVALTGDIENEDWTKRTWDLPFDNAEDLREYIEAIGMTVEEFKRLPIYRWNVDKMPWLEKL